MNVRPVPGRVIDNVVASAIASGEGRPPISAGVQLRWRRKYAVINELTAAVYR